MGGRACSSGVCCGGGVDTPASKTRGIQYVYARETIYVHVGNIHMYIRGSIGGAGGRDEVEDWGSRSKK